MIATSRALGRLKCRQLSHGPIGPYFVNRGEGRCGDSDDIKRRIAQLEVEPSRP